MHGQFTKVPLRDDERWAGATTQAARVLFDHEANLNLAATARTHQDGIQDVVGPAGVWKGSDAFKILTVARDGNLRVDLGLGAGRMWVGGLEAFAPTNFTLSQGPVAGDSAFVLLDVFVEHVQPVEDPDVMIDAAIAPIDSAARTRVGYRVEIVAPPVAGNCTANLADYAAKHPQLSNGRLTIARSTTGVVPDLCAPPGDPFGVVPDGMLRVEVLDGGHANTATFAWAYDNGARAATIKEIKPDLVTIAVKPTPNVKFEPGDLVEVSWLERRAARAGHGPLYEVASAGDGVVVLKATTPIAAGSPALATPAPEGLVLRRWDGQHVGATAVDATLGAKSLGIAFTAIAGPANAPNDFLPGDWWGAELREAAVAPLEARTAAPPDGVRHFYAPLAMLDLVNQTATDCRPTFDHLVDIKPVPPVEPVGLGVCTVVARPGDDLQQKVDELWALIDTTGLPGGELCIAAGRYEPKESVTFHNFRDASLVVSGVGPGTLIHGVGPASRAAFLFKDCYSVAVRNLAVKVEGGSGRPVGDGALTFWNCDDVEVSECVLQTGGNREAEEFIALEQIDAAEGFTAVSVVSTKTSVNVALLRNRARVGPGGAGFVTRGRVQARIADNDIVTIRPDGPPMVLGISLTGVVDQQPLWVGDGPDNPLIADPRAGVSFDVVRNRVDGAHLGIRIESGLSDDRDGTRGGWARRVQLHANVVRAVYPGVNPAGMGEKRQQLVGGVLVRDAYAIHVDNHDIALELLSREGLDSIDAVQVGGLVGPFMVVRQTSSLDFPVAVRFAPDTAWLKQETERQRMWLVAETMADKAHYLNVAEAFKDETAVPGMTPGLVMFDRNIGTP